MARDVIAPHIWRLPLLPSAGLRRLTGARVYLKLECLQPTGSFKVRGALHKLASLSPSDWERGLVTASAGNHGLGVSYACQALGLPPVTIFVPESTPAAKLDRLSAFDCQVSLAGADYDACHALAHEYAQKRGATYISAYDDPVIIAGQATVALEIMEDLPGVDLLLVPVGGGGLIAGIALAVRAINPSVRVLGVQPEASPAAYLSLRDGHPYEVYAAAPSICDGVVGGFGRVPFEVAGHLIDEILVVPEADVRQAVSWLLTQEQIVVEGSGALAIAPLLSGQLDAGGQSVVAVLTGRNLDVELLCDIVAEQSSR
jgi:threonine dehydratase